MYGLLGAAFVPAATGHLRVEVAGSEDTGNVFFASLASSLDDVFVGLPREYVESVLDGACSASNIHDLGAGILRFDCAAHGHVGSSQALFRQLGEAVVLLFGIDPDEEARQEISELLQLERRHL